MDMDSTWPTHRPTGESQLGGLHQQEKQGQNERVLLQLMDLGSDVGCSEGRSRDGQIDVGRREVIQRRLPQEKGRQTGIHEPRDLLVIFCGGGGFHPRSNIAALQNLFPFGELACFGLNSNGDL